MSIFPDQFVAMHATYRPSLQNMTNYIGEFVSAVDARVVVCARG